MVKTYSIAEARDNFTAVVHEVETGTTVELTRRGKSVAMLMDRDEYSRLSEGRSGFTKAYEEFLRRNPDFGANASEPDAWLAGVRDPSPGRDFSW